jgi:hypothetical protein|tara:strand:+ start:193 stop:549 length:357 start_codon:yes stop_codon:yes gene_type:complete
MPLPALGAVAQFLASNGARAAAAKFGKKAVEAAKKELSDRDKTVSDMADKANVGVTRTRSPQSIRRGQDTMRDKRVAKQEAARAPKSPKEEVPLKFKKGGKVRGAGIERKGLRPAKMR